MRQTQARIWKHLLANKTLLRPVHLEMGNYLDSSTNVTAEDDSNLPWAANWDAAGVSRTRPNNLRFLLLWLSAGPALSHKCIGAGQRCTITVQCTVQYNEVLLNTV